MKTKIRAAYCIVCGGGDSHARVNRRSCGGTVCAGPPTNQHVVLRLPEFIAGWNWQKQQLSGKGEKIAHEQFKVTP